MRGAIHHLDLTVKDPDASRAFYTAVLAFMGYQLIDDHDRGYDFNLEGPAGVCSIGVMAAKGPGADRQHDRYSPGLHHVAWNAAGREDVDAMYAHLQSIGATILDPPADYPEYGLPYYAVFFADPDGLKLEFVGSPHPVK